MLVVLYLSTYIHTYNIRRVFAEPPLWHCYSSQRSLACLPVGGQVVVSGPEGFVFHVEAMLADMGVPPRAVVMLD